MLTYVLIILLAGLGVSAYAESELASPLKQLQIGVPITEIQCADDMILLKSPREKPTCVRDVTAERLVLRGWTVMPAAEPAQVDVIYLVDDGRVSLADVPRLNDSLAVWFPMSLQRAPDVAQRLADGLDDEITLPLVIKKHTNRIEYDGVTKKLGFGSVDSENNNVYYYKTKKGGLIQLHMDLEESKVRYMTYYVNEKISGEYGKEFLEYFMDESGFRCTGRINEGVTRVQIPNCGTGYPLVTEHEFGAHAVSKIQFRGWSDYQQPGAYPNTWDPANLMTRTFGYEHLSEEDLRYLVYMFVKENPSKYNCLLKQHHFHTYSYKSDVFYEQKGLQPYPLYAMKSHSYIHAGVPIVTFEVGTCGSEDSVLSQKRYASIDAISGTVIW